MTNIIDCKVHCGNNLKPFVWLQLKSPASKSLLNFSFVLERILTTQTTMITGNYEF